MSDKKSKTMSKLQESRLKTMKQKEETITGLLTTTKNNPNFVKLLVFTLNTLENFVSPPNREIRVNGSVIIRLEGVGILHTIIIKNINKDEIVTKAGEIIWKLISVYNNLDPELAKLFAEKNGHKLIIEILVKRQKGPFEVISSYIKVLNGLAQIPQLVPSLLDSGLVDTFNFEEENLDMISLNLDTLKKLSNQKVGRDFLISKNFVEKIIKNIKISSQKNSMDSVLCGLSILDNLSRNEEGKQAIKESGGIDCLSEVLDVMGHVDYLIRMSSKIYGKIAIADDMKSQIESLKEFYEKIKAGGLDSVDLQKVKKCLVLISNFMLVEELGKQLQNLENFKILEGTFEEIQKANLDGKGNDILKGYVLINKYFMQIFYRLFSLQTSIYNKNTEAGKEEAKLLNTIQNSIKKIWEISKKLSENDIFEAFSGYFSSYGEIIIQKYKILKENQELDEELSNLLCYINTNVLVQGQKNFRREDINSHRIASTILKISDELGIHNEKETKKKELVQSLSTCLPYLESLFTESDEDEILCNSLEVIYDLLNSNKDIFQKNIEAIIFKICDFMNKKMDHRYPCLQSMKLLDKYLTKEFISKYVKEKDPKKYPTHHIDFAECIVNVLTYKEKVGKDKKGERNVSTKVEEEINEIGSNLIERLFEEQDLKKIVKDFCVNADSFEPYNIKNKEVVVNLEKLTKIMIGLMTVIKFYEEGAVDILKSLKNLIEKEVKYIEFYKIDKENQKKANFSKVLEESSNRLLFDLSLALKITETSQKKSDYKIYVNALDILFLFLSKSSNNDNINLVLNYFNKNSRFILSEEPKIFSTTKENITEKETTTHTALLRKIIEEEEVIGNIIDNLTILAENKQGLCNTMVKGGCPRLLLQIMETSPYEENVEKALNLLKIIAFCNLNNLTMVANQNAMIKFFETKNKFHSNQTIINYCDEISNEILKQVPGQDTNAEELIKDAIVGFNENIKNDFSLPETKQKLLNNLEIINSFSTNKTQFENLNNEAEFITNLKTALDKIFEETNMTQVSEKLFNNLLSLLKKLNSLEVFDHEYIIGKLISIIKNKSNLRDILLSATEEFSKYLMDEELYSKLLKGKLDNSFIDAIFEDIDNNLGDIKVSKELNNILCYLCLRDEQMAAYIKSKGGLTNVLEELKGNIDSDDVNSKQMKINAIKMLSSLCNDKEGMESLIKANGLELLNKTLENEADNYGDFKPNDDKNLFKTRGILKITEKEEKEEENKIDNYIGYCIQLIKNVIEQGNKEIGNAKNIKNLLIISEGEYPKKEVFLELCKFYNSNEEMALPQEDNYLYLFLKQILSFKAIYNNNKEIKESDKIAEKILNKLKENQTFFDKVKSSIKENKNDNLQLTYLSNYVTLSDTFAESGKNIIDDIITFLNDLLNVYKEKLAKEEKEEIPEGIIICLMNLFIYALSNKKDSTPKIEDYIETLLYLGEPFINNNEKRLFTLLYEDKFNKIFELIGKTKEDKSFIPEYKKYIERMVPKCISVLNKYHEQLNQNKDYNQINKDDEALYDLNINIIKDFFSIPELENTIIKTQEMINSINDLITDFQNLENYEQNKLFAQLDILYSILENILKSVKDKEIFTNNDETFLKILSLMKISKEKGYPNTLSLYEHIFNILAHNLENASQIYDKITEFIADDFKQTPQKEIDLNLDTLAAQTKYASAVKYLLNNIDLEKAIHELYKDENINVQKRRNISTIYNNLTKNTYNVDNIIQEDPDFIKTIIQKVNKPENAIKEKENADITNNELSIINSIVKDESNFIQIKNKNLITKDDLTNIINTYKSNEDKEIVENIKDIEKIVEKMETREKEQEQIQAQAQQPELKEQAEKTEEVDVTAIFKVDIAILNNIKKRIEESYSNHLEELKKLNPKFDTEETKEPEASDNITEVSSVASRKKIGSIASHLFYNKFNSNIVSQISTKLRDDISNALDSLLALIRLLYSGQKDNSNPKVQEERMKLLNECIYVLKMLSICSDNHKPIIELGLLNFYEKILSEKKPENFKLCMGCLDVLKNCSLTPAVSIMLIDSTIFDNLLTELLDFYYNPDKLKENEDIPIYFLYENILFSNIMKTQKGFEVLFSKIAIDKLIYLGKNTGNISLLTGIIEMLIHYIEVKKEKFTDEQLINVISICNKGLTIPERTQELLSKSLKLTGLIYNETTKEKIGEMVIVKIVNDTFEDNKEEKVYFQNALYVLGIICLEINKYAEEIIDTKLLDKIMKRINLIIIEKKEPTIEEDELMINYSDLLKNILEKKDDLRNKICTEELFENVLKLINLYSPLIIQKRKLENMTTSQVVKLKPRLFNAILLNLIKVLTLLTVGDECKDIITNIKFIPTILDTISKPGVFSKIVIQSLLALKNYFSKDIKDKWIEKEIEELYNVLKSLQKDFYANSEILTNINYISGYILKGCKTKPLSEKYYLLCLEGLNCQDWNLDLVLLSLKIIKENLISREDLRNDVFEQTKQSVMNILRIYLNSLEIQILCFEILSTFAENKVLSFNIVNSDIMESIRDTLGNPDFKSDPEKRTQIRICVFKLLNYLAYDDTTNAKIASELLEPFINDLSGETFTEDLIQVSSLLSTLLRSPQSIDLFIEKKGIEALCSALEKFYEHRKLILNCFKMIKEICFSNEENKKKLKECNIEEKIKVAMDNCKPEDKIIKFEGKIAINNITYEKKEEDKTIALPNDQEIKIAKLIKGSLYDYITNGITVKGLNPKGKPKEFILSFSPDLMKIYFHKPKTPLVPAKAKYTLETPLSKIVKGHGTDLFKKAGGVFSKPPDKALCFSIIMDKQEGEKKEKSLNVICNNDKECEKIFEAFEIGFYHVKIKCGKAEKGTLNEKNMYLTSSTNK